jgi:radical SAM superfamily enzyme
MSGKVLIFTPHLAIHRIVADVKELASIAPAW